MAKYAISRKLSSKLVRFPLCWIIYPIPVRILLISASKGIFESFLPTATHTVLSFMLPSLDTNENKKFLIPVF